MKNYNDSYELKEEDALESINNDGETLKPFFFNINENEKYLVTLFKPYKKAGKRRFHGKEYGLIKCLVHEINDKEIDFNLNHFLQFSKIVNYKIFLIKLKYLKIYNKEIINLIIIRTNKYDYRIQNIDDRSQIVECRMQNVDSSLQNVDSRMQLVVSRTQLYRSLSQDCPNLVPKLSEEFVKDDD